MSKEESRDRPLRVLPHLRYAVEDASARGLPKLAIVATEPDGSGGSIVCMFDASEFISDVECAIEAPAQTEEDTMEAKARQLADLARLSGAEIVCTPLDE